MKDRAFWKVCKRCGVGGDYALKFIGQGGVCGERSPRDTHGLNLFPHLREGHVRRQLLRARAAALFEKSGQSADTCLENRFRLYHDA